MPICPDGCPCCCGACCTGDDCVVNTKAECDALGGTWEGGGTTCDPDPCLGACCDTVPPYGDPPGTCTQTYEDDCTGVQWTQGVPCDPNPCQEEAECFDNEDCPYCQCCEDYQCVAADSCPAVTSLDSLSWCGATDSPADLDAIYYTAYPCDGEVTCPDTSETFTFLTEYGVKVTLTETVACGATQSTSATGVPTKAARDCRYLFRVVAFFGQGDDTNSCKARYWWGYLDTDPCAPSGGTLTMVADTGAAVNNSAIGDCTAANTPGCRSGCDTDVDDCFATAPSISISFPP